MEEKIKALFISYLEKSISKPDEEILVQWIKNNPGSLKEWSELKKLWNLVNVADKFNDKLLEKEWQLLLNKIEKNRQPQRKLMFWYWLPRVAAVFLLGAFFSLAVSYSVYKNANNKLVYQEITTPKGAKSKLTLPDGSTIWLNAGSTVKYSNQFGLKQREIFLTGEAFFNVVSNKRKAFVVQASDLRIKAYGTSFNVKSYPDENTVEATLIEGSLGVKRLGLKNKKNDEVILEPNQRVVYYKSSPQINEIENVVEKEENNINLDPLQGKSETQKLTYMISKGIDPQPFTSWKDGTLFINSETLELLAVKLERKYDMKIHFENEKLKNLKFTGSLQNETIEQVIEAIGIAAHINYRIDEREIWLSEIKSNN